MHKLIKFLTSRLVWVIIIVLMQFIWIIYALFKISGPYYAYVTVLSSVIAVLLTILIVRQRSNSSYKLSWAIVVLGVPLIGPLLFLMFGGKTIARHYLNKFNRIEEQIKDISIQDNAVLEQIGEEDPYVKKIALYLNECAHAPMYDGCETEYFPTGEDYFKQLCIELEKAERFIFIEYFIIKRGLMWDTVMEILERKAKSGVEVRIIYDDMGCIGLLPFAYEKKLAEKGIHCRVFNKVYPVLSAIHNNRDHRKITVVDGRVGFTGGINMADEYINHIERFGYWKDAGIMIKGEAVWNMTAMFLSTWNSIEFTDKSFEKYLVRRCDMPQNNPAGFVQPFGDMPFDTEQVAENVYLSIITSAKKYVYFYTPYLIIDDELMRAFLMAAKSGVDVRIMTPHIPDKKFIFMLTRSYYKQLIDAGVKVYEYLPGFLHSKCCVSDDTKAVVGSINLDFRSLYLHFECGTFVYGGTAVNELYRDYMNTLKYTLEIDDDFIKKIPWYIKMLQAFLRLFAPLL